MTMGPMRNGHNTLTNSLPKDHWIHKVAAKESARMAKKTSKGGQKPEPGKEAKPPLVVGMPTSQPMLADNPSAPSLPTRPGVAAMPAMPSRVV